MHIYVLLQHSNVLFLWWCLYAFLTVMYVCLPRYIITWLLHHVTDWRSWSDRWWAARRRATRRWGSDISWRSSTSRRGSESCRVRLVTSSHVTARAFMSPRRNNTHKIPWLFSIASRCPIYITRCFSLKSFMCSIRPPSDDNSITSYTAAIWIVMFYCSRT